MSDLIAWLRGCLDDDERAAREAAVGGRWRYSDGDTVGAWNLYDEQWAIASMTVYDTESYDYRSRMPSVRPPNYIDPDAIGRHIEAHDPARVLAEVDAKRAILDLHSLVHRDIGWIEDGDEQYAELEVCGHCVPKHSHFGTRADVPTGPCPTVRLLAQPYAGRDGWREEWRA